MISQNLLQLWLSFKEIIGSKLKYLLPNMIFCVHSHSILEHSIYTCIEVFINLHQWKANGV